MDRHSGVNLFHTYEIRPGRGRDQQLGSRRAVGIFPKPEIERSRHTECTVVLNCVVAGTGCQKAKIKNGTRSVPTTFKTVMALRSYDGGPVIGKAALVS